MTITVLCDMIDTEFSKEDKVMKRKIISLLMVGTMVASITACGGGSSDKVEDTSASVSTEETGKTEEELAMDDGYDKVDSIDLDIDESSLKYTGYEIVDGTDNDQNAIKEAVVYFDYTNKTAIASNVDDAFNVNAYQGGISLTHWLTSIEGNEPVENAYTKIKDGATLSVGLVFELENTEDDLEIQVSRGYSDMYTDASDYPCVKQIIKLQ